MNVLTVSNSSLADCLQFLPFTLTSYSAGMTFASSFHLPSCNIRMKPMFLCDVSRDLKKAQTNNTLVFLNSGTASAGRGSRHEASDGCICAFAPLAQPACEQISSCSSVSKLWTGLRLGGWWPVYSTGYLMHLLSVLAGPPQRKVVCEQ